MWPKLVTPGVSSVCLFGFETFWGVLNREPIRARTDSEKWFWRALREGQLSVAPISGILLGNGGVHRTQ